MAIVICTVVCSDHNNDVKGVMRMDDGGDGSHMDSSTSTKLWFVVIIWRSTTGAGVF